MNNSTIGSSKTHWSVLVLAAFLGLSLFWLLVNFSSFNNDENKQIWAASYQVIAFIGGILGILYSRLWGGSKSYIGRGILLLALGLLLQCFGQTVYSWFIFYMHVDVPYPSFGDIGFFGSVLMYIGAITQFARASGVSLRSKYFKSKESIFILPIIMLVVSYFVFLQGYEFDWTNPIKIFLDLGYPFAEAIYVSIALVAVLFCQQILGGVMKKPLMFLVIAFIFQYISDFMFLYQSSQGTWSAGGVNDLMYSVSYLLMTLGIIYLGKTYLKIKAA